MQNNFRSYSFSQYDTLDTLITLKDLGMSLGDISNYLNNRTPSLGVQMLIEEKRKIEEKIKRLKGISNKIGDKIKVINDGININLNREVSIKENQEEYLIVSHLNSNSVTEMLSKVTELINYFKDEKINSGYPIGAILSKENIHNNRYTEINSLFMKVDRNIKNSRIHVKPAGTYGCINHIGTYETTYKSYEKLVDYINDNGYEVIGDSYEWTVFDALTVKSQDEYFTQITIPIKSLGI